MHALAPLPVAVPLLTGAVLSIPNDHLQPRVREAIAIAAAAAVAVIGIVLVHGASAATVVHWFGGWSPRNGNAIGIDFAVDTVGAATVALAGVLVVASFVFSWRYLEDAGHSFHVLMLVFLGAMSGLALSGDLFNLFVFFELMSVTAFALAGFKIEERGPIQGAFNFAVTNTIAAFLILLGIGLLYGRFGVLNLAQLGERVAAAPVGGLTIAALTMLLGGFLVKAAIVPFHFWLADAHAVAPAPVCVLFSGVMVQLGLLAAARVYWTVFSGALESSAPSLRAVLIGVGLVTAFVGAVMALLQRHLKRLLAYSTIAHSGILLCGIGLLEPAGLGGVAAYVLAHGLLKAGLFLCAGVVLSLLGSVDELHLRGLGRLLPVTGVIFMAAAVGLAGPPFLGTYVGKSTVDEAAVAVGIDWLPLGLALASALATAAVLRAGLRIFAGLGRDEDPLLSPEPEENEAGDPGKRTPWQFVAPAAALVAAGLLVGAVPSLATGSDRAAHQFADRDAYVAEVLSADHVTPPPGRPHAVKASGIGYGLGATVGAILLALLLLVRRRTPSSALALLRPLRLLHSGHVGDYVAFLTVGVAVLGGLFALAAG